MPAKRPNPPALRFRAATLAALLTACAGPGTPRETSLDSGTTRSQIVRAAVAQVGAPYRWGGDSPEGFDCSGLVVYSYAKAGMSGLPHSAARLEGMSSPVPLRDLKRGDLLFFRLDGAKARHVAIYIDDRHFVHAPSGGKRVERVSFEHPYWGSRLSRAGRLIR